MKKHPISSCFALILTVLFTAYGTQAQVGEIGVATAGALTAYAKSNIQYKTLKTYVEMSEIVDGIYRLCHRFESLNDCHNKYSNEALEQAMVSHQIVPSLTNPFGNPYVIKLEEKTLSTDLRRQESCEELTREDWPTGVGFENNTAPSCQNGVLTLYLQD